MSALILYVEDNAQNMRLVQKMLDVEGFKMFGAQDGHTGIEAALYYQPNIILMDMDLPDMDGMTVTARLRELPQFANTPIIALTASAMDGDRERFIRGGCNAYLAKPITRTELINAVRRFSLARQIA